MNEDVLPPEIRCRIAKIARKNQLSVNTLFEKNTELSQITWETLKIFELNLRWHVDQVMLGFTNNPNWRQDSEIFIPKHISRSPKLSKNYQVVGLGFLSLLFSDRYHATIWVPCLKSSLPAWVKTRRELHKSLSSLVQVRNRIAHHEIIYNYPLIEIIDFAQQMLIDINPVAADEIRERNYAKTINKIRLGSGGGI